ncbi:MAG: radical SAM/SPASM domain-containing protein [Vulcanimicrobiaceae bacterium]
MAAAVVNGLSRAAGFVQTLVQRQRNVASLPRMLTYTVTFTCNARCVMCDSWRKDSQGDLTLAEIERIFDQLPPMDVVRLTGGETFVRRDLTEIARAVSGRLEPALLHVTTNGFLTDRIVDFCERRPKNVPLQLLVSIDGVGEKHDEIRGHAGAFRSAMRTLQVLAPRRKELRLTLAVNQTVVDSSGAAQYEALHRLLAPLGIKNQVVVAYKDSATYSLAPQADLAPRWPGQFETYGELSHEDLERLFDAIEEDLASYSIPERAAKRYYLAGIRSRLLEHGASPNPKCVALNAHMRIFPNGDVPTCQFNGKRVGNLREQSFAKIWFGEEAGAGRRWVQACPGCWAECEVLPSALYTGDLVRHALATPASLLPARRNRE